MIPLLIDEAVTAQAQKVVAYASLPEHLWSPNPDKPTPGDDPNHCMIIPMAYRAVFSFTVVPPDDVKKMRCRLVRHLSVSIYPPEGKRCISPVGLYTVATDLFGFTGWDKHDYALPKGWYGGIQHEPYLNLFIAQPVIETDV